MCPCCGDWGGEEGEGNRQSDDLNLILGVLVWNYKQYACYRFTAAAGLSLQSGADQFNTCYADQHGGFEFCTKKACTDSTACQQHCTVLGAMPVAA